MRDWTVEEVKEMTEEEIEAEITNRVYEAALFFETLEHAGKISTNGHHLAQKIANFAGKASQVYRKKA